MMRFLRILLIVLGIGLLLLVLVVGLLLTQVDVDRFRGDIAERVEQATGRTFVINGQIQRQGILNPKISLSDIHLGSVAGTIEPDLLQVEKARANVDLLALLKGSLSIRSLELEGVRLVLDKGHDGVPNWRFEKRGKAKDRSPLTPGLLISRITAKRFVFVRKMPNEREFVIDLDTASMDYDAIRDRMDIVADGRIGEAPTTARGHIADVSVLPTGQRAPSEFDLTSESAVGTMRGYMIAPSTGSPSSFALELDHASTETVGRMLDLPMPVIHQVSGTGTLEILGSEVAVLDAKLRTQQSEYSGRVEGKLGDAKRLADIDLMVHSDDGDLTAVVPFLDRYLPTDIRVSGTARVTGDKNNLKASDIDAKFQYDDVTALATGSVENLRWGSGFDLNVDASTVNVNDTLPLFTKWWSSAVLLEVGPVNGQARLSGEYRSLGLSDIKLELDDPRVSGDVTGRIGNLVTQSGILLSLDLGTDDFTSVEQRLQLKFPGEGGIRTIGTLTGDGRRWLLTVDRGTLRSAGLSADFKGTIGDLLKLSEVDLGVEASVDNLSTLNSLFDKDIPAFANGFLDGRLQGARDDLSLAVDLVSVEDERLKLKGTGRVVNLTRQIDLDLKLQAGSGDLPAIGYLFGKDLKDLGEISVDGRLIRENTQYRLEQIVASSLLDGFQIDANGKIADLSDLSGIDLAVTASAASIANLPVDVPSLPQSFGPVSGSTNLLGNISALTARDLLINSQQDKIRIAVSGAIEDVRKPLDGNFTVNVDTDNLAELNAVTGRNLPELGPVALQAEVSGAESNWLVTDLTIDVKDPVVKAAIGGRVQNLGSMEGAELNLDINTNSLAMLGNRLGMDLKLDLPVSGKINIGNRAEGIALTDIDLYLGDSKIGGELLLEGFSEQVSPSESWTRSLRRVTGELSSAYLDLKPALPEPSSDPDQSESKDRFFSEKPLPLKNLKKYVLDVGLNVETLETHKFLVTDIDTRISLNNSTLRMAQDNVAVLGGRVDFDLQLDASGDLPRVILDIAARGLDPALAPSQKIANTVTRGFVDLDLSIAGRGGSVSEVMSNANGAIEIEANNILANAGALELVGSDITLQVLRAVNPFMEKEDSVEFDCGLIQADIDNGVLISRNTIAAQSKRISIVGGGVADLGTEQLEFVVNPKPRKGFGISPSNLARVVRIGGSLARPKLEVDPTAVLLNGAKVGAAIYTGGLTLFAEGLLNRLRGLDNVCDGVRTELKIRAGEVEPVAPVDYTR